MNSIVFFRPNLFSMISKGAFRGDRISNPGICSVRPSSIPVSQGITEFTHRGEIVKCSKDIQKKHSAGVITRRAPDRIFRSNQAPYESPVKELAGKIMDYRLVR